MSNGSRRGPGRPPKSHIQATAPQLPPDDSPQSTETTKDPVTDNAPTCAGCFFYRTKGRAGECRRFPPVPGFGDFLFPITHETSWCGEHQAR